MSRNQKTKKLSRDTLWSVEPLSSAELPGGMEIFRSLKAEVQTLAELTARLDEFLRHERVIR